MTIQLIFVFPSLQNIMSSLLRTAEYPVLDVLREESLDLRLLPLRDVPVVEKETVDPL